MYQAHTQTLTGKTMDAESNTIPNLSGPVQSWSIYLSGTTVEARNNKTGLIVYSNTSGNIDPVLTSIINAISPAGTPTVIEIGEGDFKQAARFPTIDPDRIGNIKIKGQGPGLTNIILQAGCTEGWEIEGATTTGKALTATARRSHVYGDGIDC